MYQCNDKSLIPTLNFFLTLSNTFQSHFQHFHHLTGLFFLLLLFTPLQLNTLPSDSPLRQCSFSPPQPVIATGVLPLYHNYFRQIDGSSQSSFDYPWEYNLLHISCSYFLTWGKKLEMHHFLKRIAVFFCGCKSLFSFSFPPNHFTLIHVALSVWLRAVALQLPFNKPL